MNYEVEVQITRDNHDFKNSFDKQSMVWTQQHTCFHAIQISRLEGKKTCILNTEKN